MIKRRIEARASSRRAAPASIAGRVPGRCCTAPTHPFGARRSPRQSLAAITLDDCKAYARRGSSRGTRGCSSSVTSPRRRSASTFERRALAAWTGTAPKLRRRCPRRRRCAGRIFFVNVPAPRSRRCRAALRPQAHRARLLRELDDGCGVRRRLREPHQHEPARGQGLLVRRARRLQLLEAVRHVHRERVGAHRLDVPDAARDRSRAEATCAAARRPVDARTSSSARSTARSSACPGRFATAQAALGQYRGLVYFGLPLDYYNTLRREGRQGRPRRRSRRPRRSSCKPGQAVYLVVGDGDAKMIVRN